MGTYGRMRRQLLRMLTTSLRSLGFVRQKRDFADYFLKPTAQAHHGVRCPIDARFDVSLYLRFGLRFDAVTHALHLLNEEILRQGMSTVRLDPEEEAYCEATAPDFECFCERLEGLPDWTDDEIETEAELPALFERTMRRIREHGLPFFATYGTLDAVVRVIETDSAEWQFLQNTRGQFLVVAAATVLAVKGRNALLDYIKKHENEPELGEGWFRDQVDCLIAVSSRL